MEDMTGEKPPKVRTIRKLVSTSETITELRASLLQYVGEQFDRRVAESPLLDGDSIGMILRLYKIGPGRNSPEYVAWRTAVFQRDDYTCQDCGERGGKLHADHIEPWASAIQKRFDLDNGRTLCVECHTLYHPELANLIRKAHYFKA